MTDLPTPSNKTPITTNSGPVNRPLRIRPSYVIALLLLVGAAVVMVSFFERIPMEGTSFALDWQSLYMGLKGGQVVYRGGSVMIAPWSLPAVLPLGFFSMRAGWGLLAVYTVAVLILSVPHRRNHMLAMFLLVISFPALRLIIDGNLEAVVIAGAALVVYGFRRGHLLALVIGILMATAKPQETWLLMIVLGIYMLRTWSLQRVFETAMSLAIVIVPAFILFGLSWLNAMQNIVPPPGTVLDMTVWAATGRLGIAQPIRLAIWAAFLVTTLVIALRSRPTLTREKAAMLITASLMLAPYAAGNSFLTPFAIGIIPMWQSSRRLGWLLLGLVNVQFIWQFAFRDFAYWNGGYYNTALMILSWVIWCRQIYTTEIANRIINE